MAWASAVGSQGVQQLASSAAGQRIPVGRESIVPAAGIVARRPADDAIEMPEERITAGEGGDSDVIEMPEEQITAGGGGEGGVVEMPEEVITAGGGGGDVVEMPEEVITAGGDGDVIEMPEETITAGGG